MRLPRSLTAWVASDAGKTDAATMGRSALVPETLVHHPFTLEDARQAGLQRWHLEGASWKRVGPGIYAWAGLEDGRIPQLEAAQRRLPPSAAFSGLTAAWLHGLDVEPCDPIEVTVPGDTGIAARKGMVVRRGVLPIDEVTTTRGFRTTTALRTLGEVCGRLGLVEGVVVADLALHAGLVAIPELKAWADAHRGQRGVRRLRRVLDLAEPAAESPMESRLRLLLELNRLPRPAVQAPIHDRWGRFAGRLDLYYAERRLGIEYDGAGHRATLAEDNRRQNRLLDAGIHLLRFTASDVLNSPDSVVAQVRRQLNANVDIRGSEPRFSPASGSTGGKRASQVR